MKWIAPNYRPENLFTSIWERRSRVFFLFFRLVRNDANNNTVTKISMNHLVGIQLKKANLWSISILTHFVLINGFPFATVAKSHSEPFGAILRSEGKWNERETGRNAKSMNVTFYHELSTISQFCHLIWCPMVSESEKSWIMSTNIACDRCNRHESHTRWEARKKWSKMNKLYVWPQQV